MNEEDRKVLKIAFIDLSGYLLWAVLFIMVTFSMASSGHMTAAVISAVAAAWRLDKWVEELTKRCEKERDKP